MQNLKRITNIVLTEKSLKVDIYDNVVCAEARRYVDEGRMQMGMRFPELQGVATYYYQKQQEEQMRNRDYTDEELNAYKQSKRDFDNYVSKYSRLDGIITDFVRG